MGNGSSALHYNRIDFNEVYRLAEEQSVVGLVAAGIDHIVVELHGHLYCGLSKKTDMVIDDTQKDVLCANTTRSWLNGQTLVFLPNVDNDVIFVFTHFLKHFYKG